MSSLYLENSIMNTFVNLSLVYGKTNIVSRHLYTAAKKQSGPAIHRSRIIFIILF